jgi:hypothetical protein
MGWSNPALRPNELEEDAMKTRKNWKDMDKAEKVEAVRSVHSKDCTASDLASRLPGATKIAILAFYKRNRAKMQDKPLYMTGRRVGTKSEPIITEANMSNLVGMRDAGMTITQMARVTGFGRQSIRRAFIRHGKMQ